MSGSWTKSMCSTPSMVTLVATGCTSSTRTVERDKLPAGRFECMTVLVKVFCIDEQCFVSKRQDRLLRIQLTDEQENSACVYSIFSMVPIEVPSSQKILPAAFPDSSKATMSPNGFCRLWNLRRSRMSCHFGCSGRSRNTNFEIMPKLLQRKA